MGTSRRFNLAETGMNIRIAALCLLLVVPVAVAQKYGESVKPDVATDNAAMVKSLDRGKQLKGSRDEYQQLPQVFAVALASASELPEHAVARAESGAQFIESKGKLVLYRSTQLRPPAVGRSRNVSVYPTVVNIRTGTLGVLTGTVIVKPKSMSDADAIASDHGLVKSKAYPQLQTVFYSVKAGVDIADVSAALQADPRIGVAYPEIIEHIRVPK
jgi:hypothetical protein